MTLLLTMLPVYLLGNLHCLGMCGPLVMMLGTHRYRSCYFFGRLVSFTLAGAVAGEVGIALDHLLHRTNIPAATCFVFGGVIVAIGICELFRMRLPTWHFPRFNQWLTKLVLKDHPLATFSFGFFTILLPCGQTVMVFAACALAGGMGTGLINGLAFALLTTPSLLLAAHAKRWFAVAKRHYHTVLGLLALIVGILSLCRGFAEIEMIPHLVLNSRYHLVLY